MEMSEFKEDYCVLTGQKLKIIQNLFNRLDEKKMLL